MHLARSIRLWYVRIHAISHKLLANISYVSLVMHNFGNACIIMMDLSSMAASSFPFARTRKGKTIQDVIEFFFALFSSKKVHFVCAHANKGK